MEDLSLVFSQIRYIMNLSFNFGGFTFTLWDVYLISILLLVLVAMFNHFVLFWLGDDD